MIFTLLSHEWKSFWRSRGSRQGLVIQILIGFFAVYLIMMAFGIGLYLKSIIEKTFPGQDAVMVFCGFILYYFLGDILFRFLIQELPTLTIQPYLTQNIRRSQLIRFLNVRSLFNFFNLLPILLFLPFTMVTIATKYGLGASVSFFISIFSLTIFNHFLILFIKRKIIINSWWLVIFLAMIAGFGLCDYFKIFSISHLSTFVFSKFLLHPWLCIVPIVLAFLSYKNNYRFLLSGLYLEDIVGRGKNKLGADYTFLDWFGTVGDLVAVDVKLMLRNKRPKSVLMISSVFLLYGFIFYKPEYLTHGDWGFIFMGAFIVTGIFSINYGQFLFAWQSSHFDGLMTSNLHIRSYIKSKFILLISISGIAFLLSSLYGFLAWQLVLIQLAAYLYNIGINIVILAYFATMSYKPIDIGRGAFFNYQGTGMVQWIYSLLILVIPAIIYYPFTLLINNWAGIAALGIAGLIGLLLQDWFIGILTKEFFKRKYLILQGFREK